MIEDLLEGSLQGVCPPDTARLGVVRRGTGGASRRRHVGTRSTETGGIVRGNIRPGGTRRGEVRRTEGGIRLREGGSHQTEEGSRLIEEGIPQIGGDTRQTESLLRIEVLRIEVLRIGGGSRRREGGSLQKEEGTHLTGGRNLQLEEIILLKELRQREARLFLTEMIHRRESRLRKGKGPQSSEKRHLSAESALRSVERSRRRRGRVLQVTGSHHPIGGRGLLIAKLHQKKMVSWFFHV